MYKYYNRNPYKLRINDCVCRAISTALDLKYEAVNNLLEITAADYNCDKLCVSCYNYLLEDVLTFDKIYCDNDETVKDISIKYPNNNVIIRIQGHLTSSIKGTISDTWDCSDKIADCYWIVK